MTSTNIEEALTKLEDLEKRFLHSREREKIMGILSSKLQSEGWVDQMKQLARTEIRKQGVQNVTVESLFDELKMTGRRNVSNDAKTEVYELIKKWIQDEVGIEV